MRSAIADKRPPRWDPVWSALQPNDFGLDEFMDAVPAARRPAVHHGERRLRRCIVRRAAGGVCEWCDHHSDGAASRCQRTPEAVRHQVLGHRQRDVGRLAVRLHVAWTSGSPSRASSRARCARRTRRSRSLPPGAMPDAMTGSGMAKKLTGQVVAEEMGPADFSAALLVAQHRRLRDPEPALLCLRRHALRPRPGKAGAGRSEHPVRGMGA